MVNPVINALNEEPHPPKWLILIPDKDILANPQNKGIKSSVGMGISLHYIIKKIDEAFDRRCNDILTKKPGALAKIQTKIIWVRMLKRPVTTVVDEKESEILDLRNKFNSILETRLFDGDADNHHIISIEVRPEEFDFTGYLTSSGKESFWREMIRGLQKFDLDEIKLKPRQQQHHQLSNW